MKNFNVEKLQYYVGPLFKAIIILVAGHICARILLKILKKALSKTKIDESLSKFIVKTSNIFMHIIIILSVLSSLDVQTTGLVAALSAVGLGVAVALKDSLGNVAGGILLLISPRFLTGDYISTGGNEGVVLDVDLLHTTIRTPDNRRISIPNGILVNSDIINYSKEENRRVDITFQVSYDADIEFAKKVIKDTINAHKLVIDRPEKPLVRVHSYGESSINIVTRTWCRTKDYWSVYFDLTEQVGKALGNNNIDIPYNQLDVHIKQK